MNPPRDVVFVSNSVDELGGVTSWTHRMAHLLAERGHRVRVVGVAPARPGRRALLAPPPCPVATLHRLRPPARATGPRAWLSPVQVIRTGARALLLRAGARRLSRLLRWARPGGVVIVTQVWAMEWVARARTEGLTVIGMSHESYAASRAGSRYRRVLRHYAEVDRLLVLTQEDADRWAAEAGLTQVGWLPNPLPWTEAPPSPRRTPVVVTVGRLSDEKGFDLLLDCWAQVAHRHRGWRLRLYGTGEPGERQALRRRTAELGLADSVDWMGGTEDVPGALRAASVFVLPSRAEGLPLALMEAMALGVPAAAFDCAPGVRELVRDGVDGLLAPPGDVGALAAHLDTLMSDAALRDRLGEEARRAMRSYAPGEIVDRWEELFSLLER